MTSISFYLAGRFARREELLDYAEQLRAMGHTVTSRWLDGAHTVPDEGEQWYDFQERMADEDVDDVGAANCLIAFSEEDDPNLASRARGGRHVELGLAIAWNMFIVLIGPRENVFMYLPEIVRYENWEEFKEALIADPRTAISHLGNIAEYRLPGLDGNKAVDFVDVMSKEEIASL